MPIIRIALLVVCALSMLFRAQSQPYSIPDDVKRIVFLGNSITYGGQYIEFIDAYYSTYYPERDYEIINVGLPSETVSGLSEDNHAGGAFPRPDLHDRLIRVIEKTQPDLVFTCYGMNDGIYLPFDDGRFEQYRSGMERLHEKLAGAGAHIIHVTPPIYDEQKGAAYANVLDFYSDWLKSKRYTSEWNVIDIHWPMKKQLETFRLQDSAFAFAQDGIHPNEMGHFEMAKYILLDLGASALSSMEDIDEVLAGHKNGKQILQLVQTRQRLIKDAWLTDIGHKRPNMNQGVPLAAALEQASTLDKQIKALVHAK